MSKKVLILCTGNSCRSQMAEVIWNEVADQWQADSAGSNPSGYVHPLALKAIQELGMPIDGLVSKHADQFSDQDFDLVVTVCDNAKETCPVYPGAKLTLHWPFPDPADATGDEEEQMVVFRSVRDDIKLKIESYLAENSGTHD